MNVKFYILILAITLSFGGHVWAEHEMHGSKTETKHEHRGDKKSHDHDKAAPEKMVYVCPMHSEVKQDQPGKCPKCGMNLEMMSKSGEEKTKKEEAQEHAGHDMHGMSGH